MDNDEREFIMQHLPRLITSTTCTEMVLVKLESEGILIHDEAEAINGSARELYRLVMTRINGYQVLERILHEEVQTEASSILQSKPGYIRDSYRVKFAATPRWVTKLQESMASPKPPQENGVRRAMHVITSKDHCLTALKARNPKVTIFYDHLAFQRRFTPEVKTNQYYFLKNLPQHILVCSFLSNVISILETCLTYPQTLVVVTSESISEVEKVKLGEKLTALYDLECATDSFNWMDLSQSYKEELSARQVRLQDNPESPVMPLDDLCELIEAPQEDLCREHLGEELLINLIYNRVPVLFPSNLPVNVPYYVTRKITTRSKVSKDVFKIIGDIFVVSGIQSRNELASLVGASGGGTDFATNQIRQGKITSRFMILSKNSDYSKVCELTAFCVHWINFEENDCTWIKSSGNIKAIQIHVLDTEFQKEWAESELFSRLEHNFPPNVQEKVANVVFADKPGMGKSELLIKFGHHLLNAGTGDGKNCRICIHVILSELAGILQKSGFRRPSNDTSKRFLLEMVLDCVCGDPFVSRLLQCGLRSKMWRLDLLLDGYDEVHGHNLKLVDECLKALSSNRQFSIRLVGTTRPHLLERLEDICQVLGYNISPFLETDQTEFLTNFWSANEHFVRTTESSFTRLEAFIQELLQHLRETMNEKDNEVAGIPLQCLLLAEVYEDDAMDYCRPGNVAENITPSSSWITSIPQLYDKLIERKIKIFVKKHIPGVKFHMEACIQQHYLQAMRLLFGDSDLQHYQELEDEIQIKEQLLKVGLILSIDPPRFIHRTFAEYFAGLQVDQWIYRQNFGLLSSPPQCSDSLLTNLLQLQPTSLDTVDDLDTFRFVHNVVFYFLNYFLKSKGAAVESSPITEKFQSQGVAEACAYDDHVHIFNAFFTSYNEEAYEFYERLLLIACCRCSLPFFQTVVQIFKQTTHRRVAEVRCNLLQPDSGRWRFNYGCNDVIEVTTRNVNCDMVFTLAAGRGEYSIVEYLLENEGYMELVSSAPAEVATLVSFMVQGSKELRLSTSELNGVVEVMRRIVGLNRRCLEEAEMSPVLCSEVDVRLLLELVNLKANLCVSHQYTDLLTQSRHYLTLAEFLELLKAVEEELPKLVKMGNRSGEDLLVRLLEKGGNSEDFLKILKLLTEKCGVDFSRGPGHKNVLFGAICEGVNVVEHLVKNNGANIWRRDLEGVTLLHYAASQSDPATVKLLLELEMDVNARADGDFQTPLHWAVSLGNEGMINYLLLNGADPEATDRLGRTPLHLASANQEYPEIVPLLLENGANVHARDLEENTPLHLAALLIHELPAQTILSHLLESGGDINAENRRGATPLLLAILNGNLKTAKFLLDKGADANITDNKNCSVQQLLKYLKETEKSDIAKGLESSKLSANHASIHASRFGAICKDYKELEYLRDNLMDFMQVGGDLEELTDSLQRLVSRKVVIGTGNKPDTLANINLLLSLGADVNVRDTDGNSLLHLCANNFKVADYFVEKGFDVNEPNKNGELAMHLLLKHRFDSFNDVAAAKRFVNLKTNIFTKNHKGQTFLHSYAQVQEPQVVAFLLDRGLKSWINVRDKLGNTALHYAVREGGNGEDLYETVLALLKHGADKHAVNAKGLEPVSYLPQDKNLERTLSPEKIRELRQYFLPVINKKVKNAQAQKLQKFAPFKKPEFFVPFSADILDENIHFDTKVLADRVTHVDAELLPRAARKLSATQYHDVVVALEELNFQNLFHVQDTNNFIPLHYAVFYLNVLPETLLIFQRNGVDFNAQDVGGNSVLSYAVSGGRSLEFVARLVRSFGAELPTNVISSPKPNLRLPMLRKPGSGDFEVDFKPSWGTLRFLLKDDDNSLNNTEIYGDNSPLNFILKPSLLSPQNFHKLVTKVSSKLDRWPTEPIPNILGFSSLYSTLLHLEIQLETLDLLLTLLCGPTNHEGKARAELLNTEDETGNRALHFAVAGGRPGYLIQSIVGQATKYGNPRTILSSQNKYGNTALHYAAFFGNVSATKVLLNSGCNHLVNSCNTLGDTPLHLALRVASKNQFGIVVNLLQNGASVNALNCRGRTPLHVGARGCKMEESLIKLLVHHEASFSSVDHDGNGVLHHAAKSRVVSTKLMRRLIIYGANPKLINKEKQSALYFAVRRGRLDVAEFLLRNGCGIENRDKRDWSAIPYAVAHLEDEKQFDMIQMLLEYVPENGKDVLESSLRLARRLGLGARILEVIQQHVDNRMLYAHGSSTYDEIIQKPERLKTHKRLYPVHFLVASSRAESDERIQAKIMILQSVDKYSSFRLEERNASEETPLLCPDVHRDLLLEMIKLGANVKAVDYKGDGIQNRVQKMCGGPQPLSWTEYNDLVTRIKFLSPKLEFQGYLSAKAKSYLRK